MRTAPFALALAVLLASPAALADAMPKVPPGVRLPVGFWTALAIHQHTSNGFMGGLEASIVHTDRQYDWVGAYVDVGRDFATDRTRLSVGPEVGSSLVGIDAGYALELGGAEPRHGFVIRPLLSLGILMIGARAGHLYGEGGETFFELGLLFKFPIELAVDRTPAWSRPRPAME